MRACSGTWIAHGSGSADRPPSTARTGCRCRPARTPGTPAPDLAHRGGGAGVLLRLRQRRAVAACATSPTCGRCFASPTGSTTGRQPALRRCGRARGAQRQPGGPGAGLSLRAAAGDDPRAPAAATILTFWHIPWPNPESFGICPWRREILQGLLGSTILGFHTRFHCKNFIETVDRYLEARIEHEHSTSPIWRQGNASSRVTRSRSNGRARRRWRPGPR
jgi:trehalose 6-phosphate synthase/phosphatase